MFFGRGPQEAPIEKLYTIEAGQTKEIGAVLDEAPRVVALNTLISLNLPTVISQDFFEELKMVAAILRLLREERPKESSRP
jgi:hypothetical protein